MKKAGTLMLAVSFVLFAACTKQEEKAPVATQDSTTESVNIVWAGWSGEEESSKEIWGRMIDTYETASDNTVTWVGWTWADTVQQLLTRSQGGEQLDIAQVDIGMFNTLSQAGILTDLNEVFGEDYLTETFEESALAAGNIDGKQYSIPWSMASIAMVYNPEILAESGWDTPPVTMEEFEQCLADIKTKNPDIIPYGVSTKDTTSAIDLMPWLWTFGATIFNEDGSISLDADATVECIEWYQDMLAKGYIAMDTGRGEARQMFAQKQVAFYDDAVIAKGQAVSNGVAPEDVINVCSAMKRPVLNVGDQPQSILWGHMLVIFKNSEHKEAAAELAKTLVGETVAMDYFENNGMPPVAKELLSLPAVTNDAYLNGFIESTATARLDETARMINANAVKSILTEELQAALLNQKTAEVATKDMVSRLNSL